MPLSNENVELFKSSLIDFKLIYGEQPDTKYERLIVLDSSFNPPHLGHFHLIKEALRYYDDQNIPVMLLLSINNVDKKPAPASFQDRIEMMTLMARRMEQEGIKVNICLTKKARFVEKSLLIRRDFCDSVIFLVGFDTIVRIFNPKYYEPLTLVQALHEFMSCCQLFCLTRETEGVPLLAQVSYVESMKKGEISSIPTWWAEKIHLVENDEKLTLLSSSLIRNQFQKNEDITPLLIESISKYICDTGSIFG